MKPKSFDPEKTLQIIADTFARNGYEGTSLDDIIKATGLGKQSLYNAFGDKKSMVKKSMDCTRKENPAFAALLDKSKPGRTRIENFFREMSLDAQNPKSVGCLVTNLLLEKSNSDKEVAEVACSRWNQVRQLFHQVVLDGIKDKSIRSSLDPDLISLSLANFLNGLRVTYRANKDFKQIEKIIDLNLKTFLS